MKNCIFSVIFSLLIAVPSYGQNLKKADTLFERNTYQEALKEYERIYAAASDEDLKWKSFFRTVESLAHLYRYGKAAQKVIDMPMPKHASMQARVLILKSEILKNFIIQYESLTKDDVIEGEEKSDIFRFTKDEIREIIKKNYFSLWDMRNQLVSMNLKSEGYYLNIKKVDFGMYPTLFDYLIVHWTNFILEEQVTIQDKTSITAMLIEKRLKKPLNFKDQPILLCAELMEIASNFKGERREEAKERWKIKRLLLMNRIPLEEQEKKFSRKQAIKTLRAWMDNFNKKEARAEAGYYAAQMYSYNEDLRKKAVALCERLEKLFPKTFSAKRCEKLRISIEMPSLSIEAKTVMPPAKQSLTITTKNIKKVYFCLISIDPYKLNKQMRKFNRGSFYGWPNILNQPNQKWLEKYLPELTVLHTWDIQTDDKQKYKTYTKTIDPPDLNPGIYLILSCADKSFEIGSSLIYACFLNVTNLALISTAGSGTKTLDAYYAVVERNGPVSVTDDVFRFYTFNAKTGEPEKNARLFIHSRHDNPKSADLRTNKQGYNSLPMNIKVNPHAYNYRDISLISEKSGSYAYLNTNLYFNYTPLTPVSLFLETDRPIYRPGGIVEAKVIVTKNIARGYKTITKQKVRFSARDTNHKEFFSKSVLLNEFGSARVSFEIPQGKLLGSYSLSAEASDGRFTGNTAIRFSVEEYKRPEFEITLEKPATVWKFNKEAVIKGSAKYYFGAAVPDANVKYRIKRQAYIPWYYRCWFNNYSFSNDEEIVTGSIKTDRHGNFSILFTPTPPQFSYTNNIPKIAQFTVEVEARDAGGRTIKAQKTIKAGKEALYVIVTPDKNFFFDHEPIVCNVKRLTINDTPAPGKATYEIFRLKDTETKSLPNKKWEQGNMLWVPPLDVQLKDVLNDTRVKKGKLKFKNNGEGEISISSLAQGVYRILLTSKDEWGNTVTGNKLIIVVNKNKKAVPINAASVTLLERDQYAVGETAKVLIGSEFCKGIYHIELWIGEHFLKNIFLDTEKPVQILEIPVTNRMKGGFSLRWFGVKDLEVHYGSINISVPWTEKKLSIKLEPFAKKLKPGQKANWGLQITDADNKPIASESLVLMYDRSLEYYMSSQNTWLDSLYAMRKTSLKGHSSCFNPYFTSLPVTKGVIQKLLELFRKPLYEPAIPGLRTWRTRSYRFRRFGASSSRIDGVEGMSPQGVSKNFREGNDKIGIVGLEESKEKLNVSTGGEIAAKSVKVRKNFADTAFFKPHVLTAKNGTARFSFTAPEQLTSWKIKVFSFTPDIKEGVLTQDAVTHKNLMARVDIPRFFRESDKGTITAIVHNESENTQKGRLVIDILENGKSVIKKLNLTEQEKPFNIKPHSQKSFDWLIDIPKGITTYTIKATAVTKEESDAEERELPILPSRQRLTESVVVALSGNESQILNIRLKDDPTRINESSVLQIDPQLALSILNSIPFLIDYPHNCVEQLLNKYVPLAIMNQLYKNYPAIKKAVKKIPARKTATPPWEQNDPRRLITLMETPWVWQSEGRPSIWPIINMLDPKIVKKQQKNIFKKLRSAQTSEGAFPWWPGGRADPYITLYVLAGFAEAHNYGIEIPKKVIQKALRYVNKKIPALLKPEEWNLAIVAYAAYVVTSFPQSEFKEAADGFTAAKSWVVWLEKYKHSLTPLGKAYLAYTHLRLGNKHKANEFLDMAMDGWQEDKTAGVYWAPEKYSWIWYSDTVEKHAFFLRTLQELRPHDERIKGMVQWLLLNRKGNVWKSTKASTAAIFSLLNYLNKTGALASNEEFKIKWDTRQESVVLKADDWIEKPIRWIKKGNDIPANETKAVIEKKGKGFAFASLTWTYSTDELPEASTPGMINLKRTIYRRVKQGKKYHLKPVENNGSVQVGDQIEIHLKFNTKTRFEYMHLKDPKASGFEAETLLSGWKYDPLWFYEEPRDSLTNFFISSLPHGEFILRYRVTPTKPGIYRIGAATLQSMYSPDMTAHSSGFIIQVEK